MPKINILEYAALAITMLALGIACLMPRRTIRHFVEPRDKSHVDRYDRACARHLRRA